MAPRTARSIRNAGKGSPRVVKFDASKIAQRHALSVKLGDALLEALGGMGTDKDKLANTTFVFNEFDAAQASMAYRSDWIARKIVDIPAWDSTREWRNWQADDKDITSIEDEEERLGLQHKTMQALIKARLFGGGALVLGLDQGKTEDPIDYEKIKKGDLKFIHAVSRWELGEDQVEYDLASPWYGEPKFYTRNSQDGSQSGVKFHPSRVIPFVGAERQDGYEAKTAWGDSVLQICAEAIKASGLVLNSSAQLIAEAKIDVIKIPGLSENISTKKYEDNLKVRFGVANLIKSVYSMLLIDKEEEWDRQNAAFTGLAEMLNLYMILSCGAADIPATRFLGQSPAGLNSTGESDIRNYYDSQASKQKLIITPKLARLDAVMLPSIFGKTPEEIFYNWNPLWQMTEKEKADIAKSKADTFKVDVDTGLIEPMVLKQARQNQLIEDGTYPGLEMILEEFDAENVDPAEQAPVVDPVTGETKDPITGEVLAPANENDPNAAGDPAADLPNATGKRPPGKKKAVGDARRHRAGTFKSLAAHVRDAAPRSLYVYRKVLNAQAIIDWAKAQGFKSTLLPDDLHVTVTYSKTPVDWIKMGSDDWGQQDGDGTLRIPPGGPRVMEQFGEVQVLVFGSSHLSYRHESMIYNGASCDYEDYNPHISITYRGDVVHLQSVEPYQGEIILGPEVFKEIKGSFADPVEQTVDGKTLKPETKAQDSISPTDTAALLATIGEAIGKIPQHTVHVIKVDAPAEPGKKNRKPRKEITKVTHDERGRIVSTEKTIVDDEE